MTEQQDREQQESSLSRRTTLTLAAGVAALGVALGMRSQAFAQGKGEGKLEAKGEGKAEAKSEGKGEGKAEGKFAGKEDRLEGKAGRIKVDVASDGSTSVDVRCADGEPMQDCADLAKQIVDKIKAPKSR